jgi:hypothetical protein
MVGQALSSTQVLADAVNASNLASTMPYLYPSIRDSGQVVTRTAHFPIPRSSDAVKPSTNAIEGKQQACNDDSRLSGQAEPNKTEEPAFSEIHDQIVTVQDKNKTPKPKPKRTPATTKLLREALKIANNAVLSDYAGDLELAKGRYEEACNLLQLALDCWIDAGDIGKLKTIHQTYSNRVAELQDILDILDDPWLELVQ